MDTLESLTNEAAQIQSFLEIECSGNPVEIQERIATLSVYMARTGKMLADAKKILREKKSCQIAETILKIAKEDCLSAKAQNALVDSLAIDENYLVDWVERINKACTHQIDALRSLLSYAKEEMASSYNQ